MLFFFFQAEDGIRDVAVTGVQTCALPISFYRLALDASKKRKSAMRALRTFRRLQFVVLPSVPAILVRGLCEHQSETASVANAAAQTLRHLELIFILRCDPEGAMSYSYLRATMGSTRIARRAGKYPATSATADRDRKSTRLNSSHGYISYAVFCL